MLNLEYRGLESLQQPEVDFDLRFHCDRFAILDAGFELPLLHGFDGLIVESQTQAMQHAHVDRLPRVQPGGPRVDLAGRPEPVVGQREQQRRERQTVCDLVAGDVVAARRVQEPALRGRAYTRVRGRPQRRDQHFDRTGQRRARPPVCRSP